MLRILFSTRLYVFTAFLALFLGVSAPRAQAFHVYTIPFKGALVHGSLAQKERKVARFRGALRIRSDQDSGLMRVAGKDYPIDVQHLYVGRVSRRPQVRFEIQGRDLAEMLNLELSSGFSFYSGRQVASRKIMADLESKGEFEGWIFTLRFKSLPQLDFDQPDLTLDSIDLTDGQEAPQGEYLRLDIDFADRAKVD